MLIPKSLTKVTPSSHVPSQSPGIACQSSALSYSLQTELSANCADPRSSSWFDRMAEQSSLTGRLPVPREHHQPRVCALQLVKDSLSHWTRVPNITPKSWIVAFLRRSRPDRLCVPNVKFAERFVPSMRKVVCLRMNQKSTAGGVAVV